MWNQFVKKWWTWPKKNSKPNWWVKFEQLVLTLTILSLSTNLFLKISFNEAYVRGLLLDYLIPKIYLFDFLSVLSVAIFFFQEKNRQIFKKNKLKLNKIDLSILLLSIIFLIYQFLNVSFVSFIFYFRLIWLGLLILSIKLDKLRLQTFYNAILISVIFQSFLAYYQFFNQKSLAPYYFFGESNLQQFATISRGQFFTAEKILPYGSTAHPNILAGIVLIFSILLINRLQSQTQSQTKMQKFLPILLLLNSLVIIFLTQSFSAFLSLLIFLFFLFFEKLKTQKKQSNKQITFWQKLLSSLLIIFFISSPLIIKQLDSELKKNHLSISRRQILNQTAWQIFLDRPIFGLGLNNFVRELENYSQNKEVVRFVQPTHHLGLLILSEGGILSLIILFLIAWKLKDKISWSKLLIFLPIASLDHYLITQVVGLSSLLLVIFLSCWKGSRT